MEKKKFDVQVQINLEHLDTVKKFNDFSRQYTQAITRGLDEQLYKLVASVVESWNLDIKPGDIEAYNDLHPRQLRKVIEAVGKALTEFFQD